MTLQSLNQVFSERLNTEEKILSFYQQGSAELTRYSGKEFLTLAYRWRERLLPLSEEIIPIFGRMTVQMMAAFWGALWAGKIPTFLSHPSIKLSKEEFIKKLQNYQNHFGSQLIVSEVADQGVFSDRSACTILLPEPLTAVSSYTSEPMPKKNNTPLFLQCSSGTTGAQKVAAISEAQLISQINSYATVLKLDSSDKIVSWLPLYHDMGLIATFLLPLCTATPAIYIDPFEWVSSPDILLSLIENEKGTFCWLPNFAFSLLSKSSGQYDLSSVKAFIDCSEPATERALNSFCKTHKLKSQQTAVCYALAENVFAATQTPLGSAPTIIRVDTDAYQKNQVILSESGSTTLVSCGKVIPGVEVRINSNQDEQIGEVQISGLCAIHGYYKQETLLDSGWLPTGDLGFFHNDELYICGRKKDLIICNGKNIYPHEVESLVNQDSRVHPGRCVALGLADENDSEEVLILFEPAEIVPQKTKSQIELEIKKQVDGYFDISSVVQIVPKNWLIKTSSGKLARGANLQRYQTGTKQNIHVFGDSHVRLLWTADRSFINARRNVHAHWWGVVWSGNWSDFKDNILKLIEHAQPHDILVVEGGEPECRIIFPSAENPLACITEAINNYRDYFTWIRTVWKGTLGFMTGPPVNGTIIGPAKGEISTGEVVGTPEARYQYQKIFYEMMYTLCSSMHIEFFDMVNPWLGNDKYLDPNLMSDYCHLKQFCHQLHFEVLQNRYGFVDQRSGEEVDYTIVWNGEYDRFESLFTQYIRNLSGSRGEPNFQHLVSSGTLESKQFVNIISWLERSLKIEVDLLAIRPEHFESPESIYQNLIKKSLNQKQLTS